MIKGITVKLYEQTQTGTDPFGAPIWTETPVAVPNVLVGEPSTADITTAVDLYGKRLLAVLGIPKGDGHDWTDKRIEWTDPRGGTVRVRSFGFPEEGVEANVPTPWHRKVRVCAYE